MPLRLRTRPPSDALRTELRNRARTEIGPIASPDLIQWAPYGALGDVSTLAEPTVVEHLIANRMNRD